MNSRMREKLRIRDHKWCVEDRYVWVYVFEGHCPSQSPEPITGASFYGMLRRGEPCAYFYSDGHPTELMIAKDGWVGFYTITDEELQQFFYFCGDVSRVKSIDWKKAGF